MSQCDNATAHIRNSPLLSTLPVSVRLNSLRRLEHVKEWTLMLESFSPIVEAAFSDVLGILIGCLLLLAWCMSTSSISHPVIRTSGHSLKEEDTCSDVTDLTNMSSASAEHAMPSLGPGALPNPPIQQNTSCHHHQVSSARFFQYKEEAPAEGARAGNEGSVGRRSAQESAPQRAPLATDRPLLGEPRQLERDIYTRVEDAVMIFE